MSFRMFFSYARETEGPTLQRFFQELAAQVAKLAGSTPKNVVFLDTKVQAGSDWEKNLFEAAAESQVLVYLLSPHYLSSDWCGKEFEVFRKRTEESDPDKRLVFLPVPWVPVALERMPEVLTRIQLDDSEFPPEYLKKGMDSIAKRESLKETYLDIIEVLARRIVEASNARELPPVRAYRSFADVPSAFLQTERRKPDPTPVASGSREVEVRCVYVAGSAQEIGKARLRLSDQELPLRTNTAVYGQGGWYWQPYDPPHPTRIGQVVQNALATAAYRFNEVEWRGDIESVLNDIKKEAANDNIVLLIVDVWSTFIEHYGRFLTEFDRQLTFNNAVLVPWNDGDQDVTARSKVLEQKLRLVFRSRYQADTPVRFYRPRVDSIEEFRKVITNMLEDLRGDIETARAARLGIEGPGIPQI